MVTGPFDAIPRILFIGLVAGIATATAAAPRTEADYRARAVVAREALPRDEILRVVRDERRHRTWILGTGAVWLHEELAGAGARRFPLPGWSVVDRAYACAPDIFVEAGGTVLVTSNIVQSLWRVDPGSSDPVALPLALDQDGHKDFGFTALESAGDGTLRARSTPGRARWQIELATLRATRIATGPGSEAPAACD